MYPEGQPSARPRISVDLPLNGSPRTTIGQFGIDLTDLTESRICDQSSPDFSFDPPSLLEPFRDLMKPPSIDSSPMLLPLEYGRDVDATAIKGRILRQDESTDDSSHS